VAVWLIRVAGLLVSGKTSYAALPYAVLSRLAANKGEINDAESLALKLFKRRRLLRSCVEIWCRSLEVTAFDRFPGSAFYSLFSKLERDALGRNDTFDAPKLAERGPLGISMSRRPTATVMELYRTICMELYMLSALAQLCKVTVLAVKCSEAGFLSNSYML
jgi:hypothetical protein